VCGGEKRGVVRREKWCVERSGVLRGVVRREEW
jgi:hypothetical protein